MAVPEQARLNVAGVWIQAGVENGQIEQLPGETLLALPNVCGGARLTAELAAKAALCRKTFKKVASKKTVLTADVVNDLVYSRMKGWVLMHQHFKIEAAVLREVAAC